MSAQTNHGMSRSLPLLGIIVVSLCSCFALATGYWMGQQQAEPRGELPPMLAAAATATDTMAVATGPIGEDSEGIFFLDFLTGRLQCYVYNPRTGKFGAAFQTDAGARLGSTKNSKFLLVTGTAVPRSVTSNTRPGLSLVYVTDTTTGMFAAFATPWNRAMESAGQRQAGELVFVDGGQVRDFLAPNPAQQRPAAIVDPANK